MKRLKYLLIFALPVYFACNKVMDTKPLGNYTGDDVWGSYPLAQGYIYNCYARIIGNLASWNYDAITKDIINGPWGTDYQSEKTQQIDKYTDEGWNNYSAIRSVNLAIQNLQTATFSTAQKNTLLGNAYFLRSVIYFTEAEKFGGVPIVRNVLTPDSNFQIPRATLKQTYDFIISDLDSAASLLPAPASALSGTASNGAAWALEMRVALQAGAYLNDNSYYTKVIAAGDNLFALGAYSLDSYTNLFNSYSTASSSPENILSVNKLKTNTSFDGTPMQAIVPNGDLGTDKQTTTSLQLFPLTETFEGWGNKWPTQDLVDDYLVTDADGIEKVWNQTSYVTTPGNNVNKMMYQHRDQRFYATILYDSCKDFNNLIFTREQGNVSYVSSPINGGALAGAATPTGYLFRKYLYQDQGKLWYSDPVNFCYSVLRLGEAYLNYAEAEYMLGNYAIAAQYMTKTYQKHGGFTNAIMFTDPQTLWTAYKRERNVEMILENGDRYWSLLRWGMQQSGGLQSGYSNTAYVIPELNGQMHGIHISIDGNSYSLFSLNETNNLPLLFTAKRYLYPVPYSQIQASPVLTQNEGWQ